MRKSTLLSLISYLEGDVIMNPDVILEELKAEVARGEAKAQANRDKYAEAKDIVMDALKSATAPVTLGELYAEIQDSLPDGFSKGKVQYAVTRLWSDEIAVTPGSVNTYSYKE